MGKRVKAKCYFCGKPLTRWTDVKITTTTVEGIENVKVACCSMCKRKPKSKEEKEAEETDIGREIFKAKYSTLKPYIEASKCKPIEEHLKKP